MEEGCLCGHRDIVVRVGVLAAAAKHSKGYDHRHEHDLVQQSQCQDSWRVQELLGTGKNVSDGFDALVWYVPVLRWVWWVVDPVPS